MTLQLLTELEAVEKYRLSARKLQIYRKAKKLIRGVHYLKIGGSVRYVEAMMSDRLLNWDDEDAHQRAIEIWKAQQLSSRKKRA